MGVTIDANVIAGISREEVGVDHGCSASASEALALIVKGGIRVCLDEGEMIEKEWMSCVDPEWYESWFPVFAAQAAVQYVKPASCPEFIKKLRLRCGFPSGHDSLYVRVAVADAEAEGSSWLLSEDLDFFEPREKANPKRRRDYMTGRRVGSVRTLLAKEKRVGVRSIFLFLQENAVT